MYPNEDQFWVGASEQSRLKGLGLLEDCGTAQVCAESSSFPLASMMDAGQSCILHARAGKNEYKFLPALSYLVWWGNFCTGSKCHMMAWPAMLLVIEGRGVL